MMTGWIMLTEAPNRFTDTQPIAVNVDCIAAIEAVGEGTLLMMIGDDNIRVSESFEKVISAIRKLRSARA